MTNFNNDLIKNKVMQRLYLKQKKANFFKKIIRKKSKGIN